MEEAEIKYFAKFDPEGYPLGFYPSDIWPEPPEGCVEITKLQYLDFMQNQSYRKYVDGKVVEAEPKAI